MSALPVTGITRGELSWQQAGRLRRDAERGERILNCPVLFPIPDDLDTGELRDRLAVMVQREDVLRITELSLADGGYAVYAPEVELPLLHLECGSENELATVTSSMLRHPFPRAGGPLWEVAVITHPTAAGRPARTVFAVFDHSVSDGWSTHLFKTEVFTGTRPARGGAAGRYPQWVAWQRTQYPTDVDGVPTPVREFWRRHLDGVHPDLRSTVLPFCFNPTGPLSGVVRTLVHDLPMDLSTVRASAARLRCSPFAILLGGVVSAVAAVAAVDDVTLRVTAQGRLPTYIRTLGFFSNPIPVRVKHDGLDDSRQALRAAWTAWREVIRFQTTPWDYLTSACSAAERPSLQERLPIIDINFLPFTTALNWRTDAAAPGVFGGPQYAGELGALQLELATGEDGRCQLAAQFDPQRFSTRGVSAFLEHIVDSMTRLVTAL